MRCDLCRTPITGEFYANALFGDVACVPCGADSTCRWCGRYRATQDHFGYQSCGTCRRGAINTESDIARLRDTTLPLIQEHFGSVAYGRLPIMFGTYPVFDIENPLGLAVCGVRPTDHHIRLQQGLPFGSAVGVLAHEYGHMLVQLEPDSLALRPRAGTHDRVIEEGFCEVMNALGLLSQSSDDARWYSFLMPASPDPVYGDGFRLMWPRAQELGSVAALLETLTGQVHPHRHPLRASDIDDDFMVPDEIAPLVEAGTGDRDRGPLRGKALLMKDLPKDAPTGPRLRGRGLGVLDRSVRTDTTTSTKGTLRGTGLSVEPDSPPPPKGSLRGRGLGPKK